MGSSSKSSTESIDLMFFARRPGAVRLASDGAARKGTASGECHWRHCTVGSERCGSQKLGSSQAMADAGKRQVQWVINGDKPGDFRVPNVKTRPE